jgi:Protein of unknown function (DUF2587)
MMRPGRRRRTDWGTRYRADPAEVGADEGDNGRMNEESRTGDDPTAPLETAGPADAGFIGQPAKIMRIGTMIKQLLDEVRSAPLDDAARSRLAEVHERSLRELEDGLSPDLVAELHRITLPFSEDGQPSDAELRIAQAQLVGWLEGLFHGLQTALVAQQMTTQAQLAQMRRALPPGVVVAQAVPDEDEPGGPRAPGQYL